jgi:hypothetical protein
MGVAEKSAGGTSGWWNDMNIKHVKFVFAILVLILAAGAIVSSTGCGVAKDTQLQMKIKEELGKHRDIQADKLTVNVKDGVVTISGELYTQEEIDNVVAIVSAMEGVVEVKDQMNLPDNFNSNNPTFLYY